MDDLDPNPPMHTIQQIVTPGPQYAMMRVRVPTGWLYIIRTGQSEDTSQSALVPIAAWKNEGAA